LALRLTLLGKPDCHLCHEMRDVVNRVLGERAAEFLVERDVADDPDLERQYVFEIPVLLAGEREIARHAIGEAELRARLVALGLLA
jgi:hypothetical protein